MEELYKFFKFNGKVVDIDNFNDDNLKIFSREVLKMIVENQEGWEEMLPKGISDMIKNQGLFGYQIKENVEPNLN